ncbi:MAG: threonine synthase [Bacteroidia bacterium]|nr:threonine synthase [Bacteroidia bacterium]MBT8278705.1 threonine synthase [Bacteroidia bacterium]NND25558.1 threonine synthase [Flavobacteriaceae bacterium]NNK60544.1 threonine synthase [Flavobacteriaceae bacterium]NNL31610.1 threonine synthase [Flavobacteriaceae bacterium]
MKYFSINKNTDLTSFKEAVIRGLAPDKGLYFPEKITPLSERFWADIDNYSNEEIAFETIKQFVLPEIPEEELKKIISETLSFDFPIVNISANISTLELFHGPTMAFKDVGARFMARCLGYFNTDISEEVTVLVATSGDTGGAVANGFLDVNGVKVVILYPDGKVSDIQERQLTTLGHNITALKVDGVFDDCQDMVKQAFLDSELTSKMQLTSANSINIARWIPQLFYFVFAYKKLYRTKKDIVFSIPSGNFGNICAGMMAQQLGMPVKHFIASNNANNVVTEYLETATYNPKPSVQTISNAMDVGNPSNFVRILEIYNHDFDLLKKNLSSFSFTDEETKQAMTELFTKYGYISDPHGAVGYLGAKKFVQSNQHVHCVFLETAHPTKFLDVVEEVISKPIELPEQIKGVMNKPKSATSIATYEDLKNHLLSS